MSTILTDESQDPQNIDKSTIRNLIDKCMTSWNIFVQNHRKIYATIFSMIAGFTFATSFMLIKLCKSINGADASLGRVCIMVITLGSYCLIKKYPVFYLERRISFLLFLRTLSSIFGSLGAFTAVQFIPLPDHTAIQYTAVAFTVVFARIFLNEPFNLMFLLAIATSILGVVMVSKPNLFIIKNPKDNISNISAVAITSTMTTMTDTANAILSTLSSSTENKTVQFSNSTSKTILKSSSSTLTTVGILGSLTSAIFQANTYIVVKKMTRGEKKLKNVEIIYNFSLFSIVPLFIACVVWRALAENTATLIATDLLYVVLSGISGMIAQLSMNMALKQYDASYVSLIRGCEIIFSFIFQATLFNLEGNYITYTGIGLMVASLFIINLYKIWQKKRQLRRIKFDKTKSEP